jgi:GxxExxY protein
MDQLSIPINYKGLELDCSLKLDVLVENLIIVELKSVNEMHPIFEAQLMTYMNLTESPKGILINFNCKNLFHEGQKTYVNKFYAELPDE